ncbi:CRISPR-associated endonuclease Cas2 [filamentous cyanobacterium LEGE 11480]|uniref:CRISPR-associated endoribonuclease Cas2 n=1 Tax=Romeriopsis navalis LEGE 11480 TaxID=2777977 RepID=A0A928Z5P6_9CYAN|nr:CRISPR-associated endonuclease Cas2 [Romeriopsis navalis]MBE9033034.1 CRISPR-associated endonuclease Cas2 [Romeriopsis navalis LEGE 11480]
MPSVRDGFYLVCYDVVDNNRRNRIAKLLKGYGLRVQKSVFECMLNDDQLQMVQKRLHKYLQPEEDQVRFYPMSGHTRRKVMILGVQPDCEVDDDIFIA